MTWVPILTQVMFKIIVILLMFKLLVGVIMDGYKKLQLKKNQFPTMREDVRELFKSWSAEFMWKYVWRRGKSYVSFTHVALALGQLVSVDDDDEIEHPVWQEYFVGLESM